MQVARRLEILLKNESAAFRQSPFRELAWFLSRMVNPADESRGRNALLADLYQAWPSDAMQTRETLRDLVRLQRFHLFFVVNPLFRESSWPQRFALLLTAFRRKIRALTNPPKAPFQ
jgi:hypothetical protein